MWIKIAANIFCIFLLKINSIYLVIIANIEYCMYVSGITWSVLSELMYLVLTEILFVRYAYYPHFKGEESEVLINSFA